MSNAFVWRLPHGRAAPAGGIMGILNLTADSFFDGGLHNGRKAALRQAKKLLADGAQILDLGAESTRPGALPVASEVECGVLLPCLAALRADPAVSLPISVDTRNAATARLVLENGASIINDVSGLGHDPAMPDILGEYKPGYVLTHSQGTPQTMQLQPKYRDVVAELCAFFEQKLALLTKSGLPEEHIVLDPGIGFGKTLEHNLEILRKLKAFLQFGRPLLIGLSMKSLFGQLLNLPLAERGPATMVACALLQLKGVRWHRVHDVAGARVALQLAEAIG